jgi:Asp-tRNA(Asn)/Glu-tRNA(Gln) amidotransferase A subunit family amidase
MLGAAGIGTATFQRALAASAAAAAPITRQTIADAEWVAGITLTDQQRDMAVQILNENRELTRTFRAITFDNSLLPPYALTPLASPEAQPDPRSYDGSNPVAPPPVDATRPTSDEELAFAPIRRLAALLRARHVSSAELTQLYLDRLHRYDPLLKCVVTFTDDLALKQAAQADRELAAGHDRGPLHGIPWGLKDVLAYPGYPTTWGAPQYRDRVIDTKAAVAERLEQAGAVLIAKLATGAFAGVNFWRRGVTRNPWNPSEDAWGSSSGSAVAAAAGLVGFTIATETGGSIINPAARCGAVGLRPTHGRVSRHGCMQLCWSLDKIGPIARTADDCALVLAAIHGADPRDNGSVDRPFVWPSPRQLSTIRVGHAESDDNDDRQKDLRVLRDLGVQLVPVEKPKLLEEYDLPYGMIEGLVTIESSAVFDDLTRRGEPKGVKMWPSVWAYGPFWTGIDYLKLSLLRTKLMHQVDEVLQQCDVYLGDDGRSLTSLTGHPKIVIPVEHKPAGDYLRPRPQRLIGRLYDETTLLALAEAYQRAAALTARPPLEKFLPDIKKFHVGEEFPDETKLYDN